MKLVFMGTPDFAVSALESLHKAGFTIQLVVTQPDKPKGRGKKLIPTPVKIKAEALGCPVAQPANINDPAFIQQIKSLAPDVMVVVAYGQILSAQLLTIPPYGSVNIHGSLLPEYRGPAPVHRAIINGDKVTGVTTMLMDKSLDTGAILMQKPVDITPVDTAQTLHDKLAEAGAALITQTLNTLKNKTMIPRPQNNEKASYAKLLSKKEGRINWNQAADKLDCFIRGMTPWPGAFTFLKGKRLKIFSIIIDDKTLASADRLYPGTIADGYPNQLAVATADRIVFIHELQGASGKRMTAESFLRGTPVTAGTILGEP